MNKNDYGGFKTIATVRAFIAIELPEKLVKAIDAAQTELKKATGLQTGWTRPETIHLTIKFLGDIDEERLPEIKNALKKAAGNLKPFTLGAGGIGGFPNLRLPRVLWAGIKDSPELQTLAKNVEDQLVIAGLPKEDKPFRPHLTFLRIKEPQDGKKASEAAGRMKEQISMDFYVDSFVLFKSTLSPKGARHDIIERIRLQ